MLQMWWVKQIYFLIIRKKNLLNDAAKMRFKEKEIPTRYDFDRYEGNSSLAYSWSP